MPRTLGRMLMILALTAGVLALGPLAPAARAAGISYQVVTSSVIDKIDNSQDSTTLKAPEGAIILKVRMKVDKAKPDPIVISSLDFTVHYMLETKLGATILRQPMVRPCEGLRWQGMQVNEYGQWLLVSDELRRKGDSVVITQASPGSYYLDLAFVVHRGVEDIVVYAATPQGLVSAK